MPRLVLLDVRADGGDDVCVGLTGSFLCLDDKGLGDLAGAGVGDRDDGAVGDERMGEEVGLELCWGDLMALCLLVSKDTVSTLISLPLPLL